MYLLSLTVNDNKYINIDVYDRYLKEMTHSNRQELW